MNKKEHQFNTLQNIVARSQQSTIFSMESSSSVTGTSDGWLART
jgi:hypothetical protein